MEPRKIGGWTKRDVQIDSKVSKSFVNHFIASEETPEIKFIFALWSENEAPTKGI